MACFGRRQVGERGCLRLFHLGTLVGLIGVALMAVGCSSMADIDRKIDRLLESRSRQLGGGAVPPGPIPSQDGPESTYEEQTSKTLPTRNPGPEELRYDSADPDRDVLKQLEGYYETVQPLQLDLVECFRIAQRTSREFITAEEEYILAAIRLLIERHRWGPRFFDDVSVNTDVLGDDGDFTSALNVVNDLRVTQRLPYGGEVEARLIYRAAQQLTGVAGNQYSQSSQLALTANIPLLRDAGLIAQEELIQAERDLIYAARRFERFRREFLVDIARQFFNLVALRAGIENQRSQIESVLRVLEQTEAWAEAGRRRLADVTNVRQNVLSNRVSLQNQLEAYQLAKDRFKIRLGIPVETQLEINPTILELGDPDISLEDASYRALDYRLDYQNQRDQLDDSRRDVANARNQLLPDLDVVLDARVNTEAGERVGNFDFDFENANYLAGVTFGLPLDREIERLNLRATMIALQRSIRDLEEFEDTLILEARQSVRQVNLARYSLRLQELAVQDNESRLEELRIKADEVDAQDRLDAERDLLQSRNDFDRAVRDLRISILEYLLTTGQLRVGRDGVLAPLEGMDLKVAVEPVKAPEPRPDEASEAEAAAKEPLVLPDEVENGAEPEGEEDAEPAEDASDPEAAPNAP